LFFFFFFTTHFCPQYRAVRDASGEAWNMGVGLVRRCAVG